MWRQGCFSVEGISFHLVLYLAGGFLGPECLDRDSMLSRSGGGGSPGGDLHRTDISTG